jgi:hypothetical protein
MDANGDVVEVLNPLAQQAQPEMPTRYAAEEAVRAKMVEYDLDERYAESLSDAVLALFAPKETT